MLNNKLPNTLAKHVLHKVFYRINSFLSTSIRIQLEAKLQRTYTINTLNVSICLIFY